MSDGMTGGMAGKRKRIILVDDNMTNLTIGKNMLKAFYEVFPAPSAAKLFQCLEKFIPDLILLDIDMPEINGYETIRRLKQSEVYTDIPVIFLTAINDEASELEGLNLGAVDYVLKPFSAPLLRKRIETHLLLAAQARQLQKQNDNLQEKVREKNQRLMEMESAVISIVAELVEFRDSVTGGHVLRTQKYLELLIEKLIEENIYINEFSGWNLDYLLPSAQLHDVGKIAISDAILNKPGRLTKDEFEIMKTHVLIGVNAIKRMEERTAEHEFLRHAKIIAGTHHEKWDGSGYPLGLSERSIPLEGRLMAIADVYDALISERPYKKAFSPEEAAEIIEEGRGRHFDPALVDLFHMVSGQFADIVTQSRLETAAPPLTASAPRAAAPAWAAF
ncbi:MAG: response regulator [Gracilibacteraceae bacterium]|jgi:putative two-component system response regulator|nr:response regulator [Gracilibacteraceae bacterium]